MWLVLFFVQNKEIDKPKSEAICFFNDNMILLHFQH